eukprot:1155175-Pelagomonas_calceolata.AAC.1
MCSSTTSPRAFSTTCREGTQGLSSGNKDLAAFPPVIVFLSSLLVFFHGQALDTRLISKPQGPAQAAPLGFLALCVCVCVRACTRSTPAICHMHPTLCIARHQAIDQKVASASDTLTEEQRGMTILTRVDFMTRCTFRITEDRIDLHAPRCFKCEKVAADLQRSKPRVRPIPSPSPSPSPDASVSPSPTSEASTTTSTGSTSGSSSDSKDGDGASSDSKGASVGNVGKVNKEAGASPGAAAAADAPASGASGSEQGAASSSSSSGGGDGGGGTTDTKRLDAGSADSGSGSSSQGLTGGGAGSSPDAASTTEG